MSEGELVARSTRSNRLEQLDMQGYFGGWLREGWATRVLTRTGSGYREAWLFHRSEVDEVGMVADGPESVVVSRSGFAVPPEDGPVVLQDRIVARDLDDPQRWARRAVDTVVVPGAGSEYPGRTELADDEFWETIGVLGGALSEDSIGRLVAVLRGWDYSRQVSFQEAFDRRLFELDRPAITVSYQDDPAQIDGESSLMYRCEIVARGQDSFEAHLMTPRRGVPAVDGVSTPEILYVLEEVSPYPMPPKTYPIATGSNPGHWPEAPPVRGGWRPPLPEVPSPSPFSQRVQLETLDLSTRSAGVMYGFVAYSIHGSCVREIVGCAMGHAAAAVHAEVESVLGSRMNVGESLHAEMIVTPQGTGPVRGAPLVEFDRPVQMPVATYIQEFIRPAFADHSRGWRDRDLDP
jgi:hypothetical protein